MAYIVSGSTGGFPNNFQRCYSSQPDGTTFFASTSLMEYSYGLENCVSYDLSFNYRSSHDISFYIGSFINELYIQTFPANTSNAIATQVTEKWMGETPYDYSVSSDYAYVMFDIATELGSTSGCGYDFSYNTLTIPTSPGSFYITGNTISYKRIPVGNNLIAYHYGVGSSSGFTATVTNFTPSNSAYTLSYVSNYGTGTWSGWHMVEYAWYEIDEVNLFRKIPPSYPTCQPNYAIVTSQTGATLEGYVNAYGLNTTVTFEYDSGITYTISVAAIEGTVTGITDTYVHADLTGLIPLTTYYYRMKVVNSAGTNYNRYIRTFYTSIS